jgi:hypothetical protein
VLTRSRRRRSISAAEVERRWQAICDLNELAFALRGALLVGPRAARSWKKCVAAGLADANRARLAERRG